MTARWVNVMRGRRLAGRPVTVRVNDRELARVSAELGTAIGSGEGGMLDEERNAATLEIFEMATGYFGWDEAHIRRADAVEITFGQPAKAGSGGLLPGEKVTARIAEVRGIRRGEAAHAATGTRSASSLRRDEWNTTCTRRSRPAPTSSRSMGVAAVPVRLRMS